MVKPKIQTADLVKALKRSNRPNVEPSRGAGGSWYAARVCVCARAWARAIVHLSVRARVCVCVRAYVQEQQRTRTLHRFSQRLRPVTPDAAAAIIAIVAATITAAAAAATAITASPP